MISSFATELIKGVYKKVQYVTYRNGRKVKRVYNSVDARVPSEIIIIADGKKIT